MIIRYSNNNKNLYLIILIYFNLYNAAQIDTL